LQREKIYLPEQKRLYVKYVYHRNENLVIPATLLSWTPLILKSSRLGRTMDPGSKAPPG
jgi:hypothetical protein